MSTGIKRVQAALVVLILAVLGFLGSQPAIATQDDPGKETEQPTDPVTPTTPVVVPPVVVPPILEPAPTLTPLEPEDSPAPSQPTDHPAPEVPPAAEPPAPPSVAPIAPAPSLENSVPLAPADTGTLGNVVEPEMPLESTTVASADPTPSPMPSSTRTAAPPVASAEVAGPLKAALAPAAENNPLVQGLMVLVLVLLGVAYFRALRSTRLRGPRLNGK